MNIGPMGMIGSAAGSPIAQTTGAEVERAKQDAGDQQRQVETDKQAEKAAGIGETEQDEQASQRDADGRRLWEEPAREGDPDAPQPGPTDPPQQRLSKDATGHSGNQLDLNG